MVVVAVVVSVCTSSFDYVTSILTLVMKAIADCCWIVIFVCWFVSVTVAVVVAVAVASCCCYCLFVTVVVVFVLSSFVS